MTYGIDDEEEEASKMRVYLIDKYKKAIYNLRKRLDYERKMLINHELQLFGKEPMRLRDRQRPNPNQRETTGATEAPGNVPQQDPNSRKRYHNEISVPRGGQSNNSNQGRGMDPYGQAPMEVDQKQRRNDEMQDPSFSRSHSMKQSIERTIKDDISSESKSFPFTINPHPRVLDTQRTK